MKAVPRRCSHQRFIHQTLSRHNCLSSSLPSLNSEASTISGRDAGEEKLRPLDRDDLESDATSGSSAESEEDVFEAIPPPSKRCWDAHDSRGPAKRRRRMRFSDWLPSEDWVSEPTSCSEYQPPTPTSPTRKRPKRVAKLGQQPRAELPFEGGGWESEIMDERKLVTKCRGRPPEQVCVQVWVLRHWSWSLPLQHLQRAQELVHDQWGQLL
jgi:hypothetical protein